MLRNYKNVYNNIIRLFRQALTVASLKRSLTVAALIIQLFPYRSMTVKELIILLFFYRFLVVFVMIIVVYFI
jgi:hypothetical protein